VDEAAIYALQRMGPPAFRAVMELVRQDENPPVQVMGYEVLHAAADADQATKADVIAFCLAQAEIVTAREYADNDWNPALAVCGTLVALGEQRVRPLMELVRHRLHSSRQRDGFIELLKMLQTGNRPLYEVDWRMDWREALAHWAEVFRPLEMPQRELDPQVRQANEDLIDQFTAAMPQFSIGQDQIRLLEAWLNFGSLWMDGPQWYLDRDSVERVVFDLCPAEWDIEADATADLPAVLRRFYAFLKTEGQIDEDARARFEPLLDRADSEFADLMEDVSRYSLEKVISLASGSIANGSNNHHYEALPEADPAAQPLRAAPKIGRNDPCPCGSGKKYKQCHGKLA
jgi:hypothetical protein